MSIQTCSDVFACRILPGSISRKPGRSGGAYLHAQVAVTIGDGVTTIVEALVRDLPRRHMGQRIRRGRGTNVVAQWVDKFLLVRAPATTEEMQGESRLRAMTAQERYVHRRRIEMRLDIVERDWTRADQVAEQAALAA